MEKLVVAVALVAVVSAAPSEEWRVPDVKAVRSTGVGDLADIFAQFINRKTVSNETDVVTTNHTSAFDRALELFNSLNSAEQKLLLSTMLKRLTSPQQQNPLVALFDKKSLQNFQDQLSGLFTRATSGRGDPILSLLTRRGDSKPSSIGEGNPLGVPIEQNPLSDLFGGKSSSGSGGADLMAILLGGDKSATTGLESLAGWFAPQQPANSNDGVDLMALLLGQTSHSVGGDADGLKRLFGTQSGGDGRDLIAELLGKVTSGGNQLTELAKQFRLSTNSGSTTGGAAAKNPLEQLVATVGGNSGATGDPFSVGRFLGGLRRKQPDGKLPNLGATLELLSKLRSGTQ